MPADTIDIGAVVRQGQLTVTPEEHPDDRAARLKREERASYVEECKGVIIFGVTVFGLVAIAIIAAYKGLFDTTATAETQRWSQGVLTAVVSGSISFVLGRKVGK